MTTLRTVINPVFLTLFVLLFAASAFLGLAAAYDPALAREALNAILLSAAVYLAVAYGGRAARVARGVALLLPLSALVVALVFITQFEYQNYPDTPGFILRLGGITTLLPDLRLGTLHPNAVATFIEGALPLAVALLLSARRTAFRILWGAVSLVLLYALLLSFSRGAWLALGLAAVLVGVLAVLGRMPRRRAVGLVIGGIALLVAGGLAVIALGAERLPFLASTFEAAGGRLDLYRNSLYLARDYAFTGLGLGGTFAMVYSRYALLIFVPFLTYSHNLPLAVWLGQGLSGLVALTGMVIAFYALVSRVIRRASPPALFHGAWLGVTAGLLHGLTDARQYTEAPWVMPVLFAGIGLTAALGRRALHEAGVEPAPPFTRRTWAVAGGTLAAVLILTVLFNRPLLAAWYTNRGAVEETRAELAEDLSDDERGALNQSALSWYARALESDPDYSPANRRLGNLLVSEERFDEAVEPLERAFASEPGYQAAVKGLGLAYMWVGRTDDAARTLRLLADREDIESELGTWGYFRHGDEQNRPLLAAYAWETLALLSLRSPDEQPDANGLNFWMLIGDTFREAGDTERARVWYERVLAAAPDDERALRALEQMESG